MFRAASESARIGRMQSAIRDAVEINSLGGLHPPYASDCFSDLRFASHPNRRSGSGQESNTVPPNHRPHDSDAAISGIERTRVSGSSRVGRKPRRCENAAASGSTALTSSARPPTRLAAKTQRCRACLTNPVPIPRPAQPRSVASWPSSRHGTGSGGWPVRIERGKAFGMTAVGAMP